MRELSTEIALDLQDNGIGIFAGAAADRTIWAGELPQQAVTGIFIIEVPSPPPHQYVDTEYPVLDFWARSASSVDAKALLRQVFDLYHRRYNFTTDNWLIEWSQALGNIVDVDRDREGGKLLRLSVQFYARNRNHVS